MKTINNNGDSTSYTYDANGNIDTITYSNGKTIKYYYNELNELIREDNFVLLRTKVYTYDAGGNLTGRSEYYYTTVPASQLGTPVITYNYTYDPVWKDKMTSFSSIYTLQAR